MIPIRRLSFKLTRRSFTQNALCRKSSVVDHSKSGRDADLRALSRGWKRDPELFPLYFLTAAILGWAGWRFVQAPTGGGDESTVAIITDSEPWKDKKSASSQSKYRYYPYNDVNQPVKESPSALNVVVIPDVTLPKRLHDQYNKWAKPEFNIYTDGNAAAPRNWKQDSRVQSRNILTGDIPPGPSEPDPYIDGPK